MTGPLVQQLNEVATLASRVYYEQHPKIRKTGTWLKLREALEGAGYDMSLGDYNQKENKLK